MRTSVAPQSSVKAHASAVQVMPGVDFVPPATKPSRVEAAGEPVTRIFVSTQEWACQQERWVTHVSVCVQHPSIGLRTAGRHDMLRVYLEPSP